MSQATQGAVTGKPDWDPSCLIPEPMLSPRIGVSTVCCCIFINGKIYIFFFNFFF